MKNSTNTSENFKHKMIQKDKINYWRKKFMQRIQKHVKLAAKNLPKEEVLSKEENSLDD